MNNKVLLGIVLCLTIICVSICSTIVMLSKGKNDISTQQNVNGVENLKISELLVEQEKERRLRLEQENKNLHEKLEYEKAKLKSEEAKKYQEYLTLTRLSI